MSQPGDTDDLIHVVGGQDDSHGGVHPARQLAQVGGEPPGLGLYFNCCARGAEFFGFPGLEAAYLERAFPDTPIAGLFGSCEIGPIAGTPELLTHTGVLALIDS